MDDIDRQLAEQQAQLTHLRAMAQRLQATRMPAGRVLDAPSQARLSRETAAGQTEAPGVLDNLKAAIWGGKGMEDQGNIGQDIARTGRDVGSGFSFGLTDRLNPELRAEETAANPVASTIGRVSGGILSSAVGPLAAAGKGAAGLLGMAERGVPALAKTIVGRIGGQMAAGAGVGAGAGALDAVGAGGSASDVGEGALQGAKFGAVLGGAAQALPEAGKPIFNAIRNSAGGRARELIEKYGGKVGLFNSGSGGALDQELKGLPANDKGIGEAAQASGKRLIDKTDALHEQNVAEPYRAAKGPIDAGPGQRMTDVDDVHQAMTEVYNSAKLTEAERETLGRQIDAFEQRYTGPHGVRVMPEKDLNDYKIMLQGLSGAGREGAHTVREGMIGDVRKLVKDKVDQGPYRELNANYHEGMVDRSELRQGLGLNAKESSNAGSDVNRVRNVLARQSQDTTTAGATTMHLDDIKKAYPSLARDIELPDVLAAKSTLGLGLGGPDHGGLKAAIKHHGVPGAVGYGLGSMAGGLGMKGAVAGVGANLIGANAAPIAGRLLYGPARALSNIPGRFPALPGYIPEIEQAYMEAKARLEAALARQTAAAPRRQE